MALQHPITIQSWFRPRRLAFLVPQDVTISILSKIVEYNQKIWDGRYNPIIVTDGKDITNYFWAILKFCFPDVIYSFVHIEPVLLEKINREISPRKINILETEHPNFDDHSDDGNLNNSFRSNDLLQQRNFLRSDVKFLKIFSPEGYDYYHFILFNFGITSYPTLSVGVSLIPSDRLIEVDFQSYQMSTFLNTVTKGINNYILPIEFSESKHSVPSPQFSQEELAVVILIGDSPCNLIYYWNRILFNPPINRKTLGQFWIPTKVLETSEFHLYIIKFLEYLRYAQWGEHKLLRLYSFDYTKDKLDGVKEILAKNNIYFQETKVLKWEDAPIIESRYGETRISDDGVNVQQVIPSPSKFLSSPSALVTLPSPTFLSSELIQGCWMVDHKIELHPERYKYTNVSYWWQLPRRLDIGLTFVQKPTRINRHGEVSVQVTAKDRVIGLTQPTENSVFWRLLRNEYRVNLEGKGIISTDIHNKIEYIQPSDKGEYLQGTLSLFGGLFQAYNYLSEPYWRECFEYMARSPKEFSMARQERIFTTLKTHCSNKNIPDKELSRISRKVASALHEVSERDRPVPMDFFYQKICRRNKELLSDTEQKKQQMIEDIGITIEQKEEIKSDVQDLADDGILLIGIRPKCPHCGSHFWYPIEELRKIITCCGCRKDYPYPIESTHFYKLNSLIVNAIAMHGTIWQCLCLYEILQDSRHCFLFHPNVDLYFRDKTKPPAELDLICISDGVFIIGEVKSSADGLHEKDFQKMLELAKEIKPDKIVFAIGETKFKDNHKKYTMDMIKELSPLNISVELLSMPEHYFEHRTYPYIG